MISSKPRKFSYGPDQAFSDPRDYSIVAASPESTPATHMWPRRYTRTTSGLHKRKVRSRHR